MEKERERERERESTFSSLMGTKKKSHGQCGHAGNLAHHDISLHVVGLEFIAI